MSRSSYRFISTLITSTVGVMILLPLSRPLNAQATRVMTFDQFPPQHVGCSPADNYLGTPATAMQVKQDGVTFSGGFVTDPLVSQAYNFYGTTQFQFCNQVQRPSCIGCSPSITMNFSYRVSGVNFRLRSYEENTAVMYHVTDDAGDDFEITLGDCSLDPTCSPGSAPSNVFLAGANITKVTITAPYWVEGFSIKNVYYTESGVFQMLDPVGRADLGGGSLIDTNNAIVTNANTLAFWANRVSGVTTDSAARVVIRITASRPNERFMISLLNDAVPPGLSTSASQDGYLTAIDGTGAGATVTVVSQGTTSGPRAFAIFRPPADFSRGTQDDNNSSRSIQIKAESLDGGANDNNTFTLLRPPVAMIHGLWDDRDCWKAFTPFVSDSRFFIRYATWANHVSISDVTPYFSPLEMPLIKLMAREHSLGIEYNAPRILSRLLEIVNEFRAYNNVAAAQADVVAHSMGGLMARRLKGLPAYTTRESFGLGSIHKLITIGTPHLGTPVATQALVETTTSIQGNTCTRGVLALAGNHAFSSVTFTTGKTELGAVGDLSGDGHGIPPYSVAIGTLKAGLGPPVPTAVIAGVMTDNANGLTTSPVAGTIQFWCGPDNFGQGGDPLARSLTPTLWPSVLGQDSDAIVPKTSQLNNFLTGVTIVPGLIHSAGTSKLGFRLPSEVDSSAVQSNVIRLLNTVSSASDFHPL